MIISAPLDLVQLIFWFSFYLEKVKAVVAGLKSFFADFPQFFIFILGIAFAFGFVAWLIKAIKF